MLTWRFVKVPQNRCVIVLTKIYTVENNNVPSFLMCSECECNIQIWDIPDLDLDSGGRVVLMKIQKSKVLQL